LVAVEHFHEVGGETALSFIGGRPCAGGVVTRVGGEPLVEIASLDDLDFFVGIVLLQPDDDVFERGQIAVENIENAIASRIAIFGETRRADEITTSYVNPGISETTTLGTSSSLWAQLYAATSAIATSDEREKQDIGEIPETVFRAWAKVKFVQFKFRSAVAKKGDAARTHIGVIAQRIKTAFESEGLNQFAYGLLCYDKWEYDPEEKTPAGDRYAVRYEECLALECAYQRWRLAKIEERLV
jgi:hypothetical protein